VDDFCILNRHFIVAYDHLKNIRLHNAILSCIVSKTAIRDSLLIAEAGDNKALAKYNRIPIGNMD